VSACCPALTADWSARCCAGEARAVARQLIFLDRPQALDVQPRMVETRRRYPRRRDRRLVTPVLLAGQVPQIVPFGDGAEPVALPFTTCSGAPPAIPCPAVQTLASVHSPLERPGIPCPRAVNPEVTFVSTLTAHHRRKACRGERKRTPCRYLSQDAPTTHNGHIDRNPDSETTAGTRIRLKPGTLVGKPRFSD
jgi:hypothetical protein